MPSGARAAAAERVQVSARLVAAKTAATVGEPLSIGIALSIDPGWHIYWLHPGDAGIPTQVTWTAASGVRIDPVQWPAPRRFSELGGYEAIGYDGALLLPASVVVTASASKVTLEGQVSWLACKDDCVRGSAPVKLTLAVGGKAEETPDAARIALALSRVPRPLEASDPFNLKLESPPSAKPGETVPFTVTVGPKDVGTEVRLEAFFLQPPVSATVGREQRLSEQALRIDASLPAEGAPSAGTRFADGVLQVQLQHGGQTLSRFVLLSFPTVSAAIETGSPR